MSHSVISDVVEEIIDLFNKHELDPITAIFVLQESLAQIFVNIEDDLNKNIVAPMDIMNKMKGQILDTLNERDWD
jgi:hypothetical protein